MIKLINFEEKFKERINLLLGMFDGLHIGHQTLFNGIDNTNAKKAIFTFSNDKQLKNGYIFSLQERLEIYNNLGFDVCIVANFEKIKSLTPNDFIKILTQNYNIDYIICGNDYKFGKDAKGNIETLTKLQDEYGFKLKVKDICFVNNIKCSTTNLKELIKSGEIESVNILLSEKYFVFGSVSSIFSSNEYNNYNEANVFVDDGKINLLNGFYSVKFKIKNYFDGYIKVENDKNLNKKSMKLYFLDTINEKIDKNIKIVFLKKINDLKL